MAFYLFFQIFVSWLITYCTLKLFYKTVSAKNHEIYQEPTFLTCILSLVAIDFSLKAKFIASNILYHCIGLCFAAIYYFIWYYEFSEISWTISLILGFVNSLLHIISWTFLLIIIPSAYLKNFKGYYLQLVFVNNIFTITTLTVYKLF